MKITRKQLKQLIKESMGQYRPAKQRSHHQISDRMKSMANAAKRSFAKDYPEIDVKIDGRQGWIVVNGKKAVNISSADGHPIQIEDMVDQMKQAYLGHETIQDKQWNQEVQDKYSDDPAFLAYLTDEDYEDPAVVAMHPLDADGDGNVDWDEISEMKITRKQLKNLIKEVMLTEPETEAPPPWFGDDGYSNFQIDLNNFLENDPDEEKRFVPGLWYYWDDEDVLVMLGDEGDAITIAEKLKMWTGARINTSVVEREDGNWAIKLNAQMTQDRI